MVRGIGRSSSSNRTDGSSNYSISVVVVVLTAYLFATVAYSSRRRPSMWSAGRMEWLALELVIQARRVLQGPKSKENDTLWKTIEGKLGNNRATIGLSYAIAPHKMRLSGDELEASAPGAGERSDVWLLAWPSDASEPTALGCAYHTTNVFPGTASRNEGQSYPESRILWRPCMALPGLMEAAARTLARELELPCPASVPDLLESAEWSRAAEWSAGVLSHADERGDVPEQRHDTDRDFSDAESDE